MDLDRNEVYDKSGDFGDLFRGSLSIVQAARNAPLIETHRQYNSRLWRARYISSQRQTGYQVTEQEHVAIVEALMRRDATATATAMVKHLQTGVQNIRQIMQEQSSQAAP